MVGANVTWQSPGRWACRRAWKTLGGSSLHKVKKNGWVLAGVHLQASWLWVQWRPAVPGPYYLDFPPMVEVYALGLWARISPFSLKLLCSEYFSTGTGKETKTITMPGLFSILKQSLPKLLRLASNWNSVISKFQVTGITGGNSFIAASKIQAKCPQSLLKYGSSG